MSEYDMRIIPNNTTDDSSVYKNHVPGITTDDSSVYKITLIWNHSWEIPLYCDKKTILARVACYAANVLFRLMKLRVKFKLED